MDVRHLWDSSSIKYLLYMFLQLSSSSLDVECAESGILSSISKLFLDAKELVVLSHTLRS